MLAWLRLTQGSITLMDLAKRLHVKTAGSAYVLAYDDARCSARDPCPAGPARNDFTRALLQSRWHFVPSPATGSSPLEQCDDQATGSSTHGSRRGTKAIQDAKALLLTAQ